MEAANAAHSLWRLPDGRQVPVDEAERRLIDQLRRIERALGEAVAEVARFYEQTGRPLLARRYVERLMDLGETPEWNAAIRQRMVRLLEQAAAGPGSAMDSSPPATAPKHDAPTGCAQLRPALAAVRSRTGAPVTSRRRRRAAPAGRLWRRLRPAGSGPVRNQPLTSLEL